jgi:hypothetical protein
MSYTPARRVGCRAAVVLVSFAAFAACAVVAVPALAADGVGDVPSVDVRPEHGDKHDPNGGQWFVLSLPPGGTGTVQAKISNPAKVPQTVSLALRDLIFADNGTPRIADAGRQQDVGAWGKPARSSVELAAQSSAVVPFTVTVPKDAEPGDHIGAIVGITANKQGTFRVVRQIGARFYVTVSGTAVRAFSITSVKSTKNSTWFPSTVDATVVLRNDGRTRVRPRVTVAGKAADGSRLLLSRSVETYTAALSVPWYGGPVDLSVRAITDDGTVRTAHKSVFIIPWGLIISVVVGLLLLLGLYRLVRWRLSRIHRLRADLERLERLVARQAGEAVAAPAVLATDEEETIAALLTALKRAERSSGAPATMARLSLALHEAGGPAVPWLVQALGSANGTGMAELIDALRASDPDVVRIELDRAALPDELRDAVLAATAAPPAGHAPATAPKPRPKRPTAKTAAAPKKGATATAPRPPKPRASKD